MPLEDSNDLSGFQVSKRRQQPIPVTTEERRFLEQQRTLFEQKTGKTDDWGEFLRAMSILGLAALSVYALANAVQQSQQSVSVACPTCGQTFLIALTIPHERYLQTQCLHCQAGLVIDLGSS